ncbi:LacI family DNA-binding transcriptional regulator [Cohnella nanjingensis]|uniref:LacI family DNA-binding transcriptional regulator n=1 Tax=Cohnella nanjingensis TaxID=1387779 RepID=A0A7X0RRR1_9BACL|nr:LacI family DNA-binding transcriptional regulator [Cohnella nanjingensis]MBB6672437.1 LacI family DNA-binding transcriptional regulator [Cohnella nanjingensis]
MSKATIKQVAAAAEVSTATVSRVLNESGYVSEEVKERVMEAVDRLNYQPSAIARSLKQDKTFMIGVIVPDISNPYFMGISRGIEDVVGQEGFQLMFGSSDENPGKEERLLQLFQEKRVDAIVLATAGGNDDIVGRLADAGVPIVLVDRKLESAEAGERLDLVAEDNAEGAFRLTSRLLEDGHVRIGVVNGPARASTGRERDEGVRQALRARGIASEPLVYNGEFSTEDGIRAVRRFLASDPRPTAIVSLNNRMSLGVLLEIVRNGLRIPDDMAVASFGEVEAGSLLKEPGLYYIDQHPYEMGTRAGELLLRRIQAKEEKLEPACEIFRHEVNRLN